MNNQIVGSALAAAVALLAAGTAQAQVAGQLMVKVGGNKIMPKVQSGDLSAPAPPGTQVNIMSASGVLLSVTYMYTDHFSAEILGGSPYKHDVVGAGTIERVGKLGTIHQISPTVLFQYRLMESADKFRPYVGAGPTFAKFYDSRGSAALTALTNAGGSPTTVGSSTSWGSTIEAGLNYKIDQHWFVDAAVLKTFISTKVKLSTGQEVSAKLNPVAINASIGYAF